MVFILPVYAEMIEGPIDADVVRVRDGDSIDVIAHIWPGQHVRVSVRVRGIDAPELAARCDMEKQIAIAARKKLREIVKSGRVRLYRISGGKYFGRVLSAVHSETGEDVEKEMLLSGFARPYQGRKRKSWCADSAQLN